MTTYMHQDAMQQHFERLAPRYNELRRTDSEPVEYLRGLMADDPPSLIADVGCGGGRYSLLLQRALPKARLLCCDINREWTNIGKRYWEKAGVAHKIDLRLAPAIDTLTKLKSVELGTFDFAFIDADKTNYDNYFEICLDLVRPGAVIAIDNVFWGGSVADESQQDDDTKAIRALNKKLKTDERIELSIVPIGDGLTLARKL